VTRNLSFRGSNEKNFVTNNGNFLGLVDLLSKYDPVLKELLMHPEKSPKYLSPQIQNELVSLFAQDVNHSILVEIQNAKWFSLITDNN
jgi:hypothetical protein